MGNEVLFGKKAFIGQASGEFKNKYVIQRKLGEGGYARVFQVQNKNTGQVYACKEIRLKKMKCTLQNLLDEINIMIDMDHPNIIRIYEYYLDDHYLRIIMEQCKDGELFDAIIDRVESNNMFTEKEAAYIFKQIISAVNYTHKNGICHRDLKPENILIADKNNLDIKVIDFGLSKHFKASDNMVDKVGTSYYIAPEVLEGKYDEKCDVWSCGVILYVILSSFPPFNGEDDEEIMSNVKKMQFEFPDSEWKHISNEAKDLISKMLTPADKRPTAEEVLNHVWVKENAPNCKENLKLFNVNKFKQYASYNKLKKAVFSFKASRSTHKEKEKYDKLFKEIDLNSDGKLSLDEIKIAIDSSDDIKISNIEEVFSKIDTDGSGAIDYNEFIASSLTLNEKDIESDLREAFDMFDIDKSGKISRDEIAKIFKSSPDADYITQIINKYDTNHDGEIDFNEFIKIMKDN